MRRTAATQRRIGGRGQPDLGRPLPGKVERRGTGRREHQGDDAGELFDDHPKTHLVPAFGHLRLDRLAPSDVDRLLIDKRAQGLSDSTVRLIYTVLRRALDYAVRDGLVRRNVAATIDRPRVAHREAAVLSPEQAQVLLEAARGERLYALYAVAMAAGLRRGEALALRWSDVDLEDGTLRVVRTLVADGGGRSDLHRAEVGTVPSHDPVAARTRRRATGAPHPTACGTARDRCGRTTASCSPA